MANSFRVCRLYADDRRFRGGMPVYFGSEVRCMTCKECGYNWREACERYPRCHYDGPDEWAPCAQEEKYIEDED